VIGRVTLSEDGFSIWGLAPPDLVRFPQDVKLMFWHWVLELSLRAKDRDLSKGLDKDGQPLRPISKYTRENRRSAMTASGKGDPSAPPLIPAWQRSRVRSLLTGREFTDHVELWWKFDPYTRDSFARILEYQKEQGRDVFGLSQDSLRRVRAQAWERWRKWRAGKYEEKPIPSLPPTILGVGERRGALTEAERRAYVHGRAKAAPLGRPMAPGAKSPISGKWYSRLIRAIHERPGRMPPMLPPAPPSAPAPQFPSKPGPGRRQEAPASFLETVLGWLQRKIAG
jgi:hypothetical protein